MRELGRLQVECLVSQDIDFITLNPEKLYLNWNLHLRSSCTQSDIEEIFEWVQDESKLIISQADMPSTDSDNTSLSANADKDELLEKLSQKHRVHQ